MKRLLIVTDSLGAPRKEPEILSYEQSWVFKIKKKFEAAGYDVFCITNNGLHSKELVKLAETKLTLYEASVVILQCGIVDCAPRVLKPREVRLAEIFRISPVVRYFAKRYHAQLSKLRNITLFKHEQFKDHIGKIFNILKSSRDATIIQIPIAPAAKGYIDHSPYIKKNIENFNKTLKKHSDIYIDEIDLIADDEKEKIYMEDFHHLSSYGHQLFAELIEKALQPLINNHETR